MYVTEPSQKDSVPPLQEPPDTVLVVLIPFGRQEHSFRVLEHSPNEEVHLPLTHFSVVRVPQELQVWLPRVSPSVHSATVHSASVLLHVPQEPVFHVPVVLSHVTVLVCVPHLLQSWLASGLVPVHSQESLILHAPHSLHSPVVVLHVRLCVPLPWHPHDCVALPEQLFGSGSGSTIVPAQLSGEGS